jgi:hypothetical protein
MHYSLIFLFFLPPLFNFGQRISNLEVHNAEGIIAIRFTIYPGPACHGYTILHSLDSARFSVIHNPGEVCGNYNAPESKSFDHTDPVEDKVNYYRLQLSPYEVSEVRSIFVFSKSPRSVITPYPNPVMPGNEFLNLRIFGASNARLKGILYNLSGKPLQELELTTKGEIANLAVGSLNEGLYMILLTDGSQAFACKFAVAR